MLGFPATDSHVKGEVIVNEIIGASRVARFGAWNLRASERRPGDLDIQIEESHFLQIRSSRLERVGSSYNSIYTRLRIGIPAQFSMDYSAAEEAADSRYASVR